MKENEYSLNLLKSEYSVIMDMIQKAKSHLFISVPNMSTPIADAIIKLKAKGVQSVVFLEFSERTYRTGYGEIETITLLTDAGIPVLNKQNINIYFFIIDDGGYFYFPKSAYHEKEGISYDLFPMTNEQALQLKMLFRFPVDASESKTDLIIEGVSENQFIEIRKSISGIKEEAVKDLEEKLKNDPPLRPEYERTMLVYKSKFQYVDLKFTGSNVQAKKVKLPPNALPFKDENLKKAIEANLKLFNDFYKDDKFQDFISIKGKIKEIREKFLVHINEREKSIIQKDKRAEFEKNIKELEKDIDEIKKELTNKLQDEINNSRKNIKFSLLDFLHFNSPEFSADLDDHVKDETIHDEVERIVSNIKFPKACELVHSLQFSFFYSDITWEDLNNEKVISELIKKELITEKEKAFIDSLAIEAKKDI